MSTPAHGPGKATPAHGGMCKASSQAYGGGATCEQRWVCPECGDVTDNTECPKGRTTAGVAIPPPLTPAELMTLVIYHDEQSRGLMHTPVWRSRMEKLQERLNYHRRTA